MDAGAAIAAEEATVFLECDLKSAHLRKFHSLQSVNEMRQSLTLANGNGSAKTGLCSFIVTPFPGLLHSLPLFLLLPNRRPRTAYAAIMPDEGTETGGVRGGINGVSLGIQMQNRRAGKVAFLAAVCGNRPKHLCLDIR